MEGREAGGGRGGKQGAGLQGEGRGGKQDGQGGRGGREASAPPTLRSFRLKNKTKTKIQKERKGKIIY